LNRLTEAELQQIHAWRTLVVRLWLVTMGAALAAWAATAAFVLPLNAHMVLGAALVGLVFSAIATMRRGKCPRCDVRIRFAPRIELPPCCARCGASFLAAESARDRLDEAAK
jgi:hypothetical protein